MGYRVAVVGATGAVGREMLKTLAERQFPVDEVAAVASGRSTGQEVSFGEKQVLKVRNLETFDFAGWDIGLFSPGASVSAVHAPARRRGRLRGDRQHQPVPHGARHPAGGAGGEPAGAAQLRQAQHHRQPELLDHPDGGGAEAAARRVQDQARGGLDLPVGVRRRQGGDGRAVQPHQVVVRVRVIAAAAVHQGNRLQLHPAHRQVPRRRLDQGGMEDGGRDQEDPRSEHRGARHLRAGAGVHRPRRGGERRVRAAGHRRRGARLPARGAGRRGGRCARGRRLRHAAGMRRRGRGVCQPHPQGPDGARTGCRSGACPTICARARR